MVCIYPSHRGNRGQVAYNNANSSREAQRDRVALVVSVGAGIFPAEDLGSTDAQQFLFFGKHWFKSKSGPFQTVENLITLLIKAVSQWSQTQELLTNRFYNVCMHTSVHSLSESLVSVAVTYCTSQCGVTGQIYDFLKIIYQ